MNVAQKMRVNAARRAKARQHYADGGEVDEYPSAFDAAASRIRNAVRIPGGRKEGAITRGLDAVGTDVYNAAARPSRIINEMVGAPPGALTNGRLPQVDEGVPAVALDLMGAGSLLASPASTAASLGSTAIRRAPGSLPMDEASRMARATEQGFTTDAYHGTRSDFDAFKRIDGGNLWGEGHYFTTDPGTASRYATGDVNRISPQGNAGEAVMPVKLSVNRPFNLDEPVSEKAWTAVCKGLVDLGVSQKDIRDARKHLVESAQLARRRGSHPTNQEIIGAVSYQTGLDQDGINRALRAGGYDGISARGGIAGDGGAGRQIMAFKPTQVRSKFAAFDPANKDSGFLLGANAGDKGVAAAALADDEHFADGGTVDKPPFDPSQPFSAADKPAFDPSQPFEAASAPSTSWTDHIPAAIKDIPHEAYAATADALKSTKDSFVGRDLPNEGVLSGLATTGKGILSAASVPFAPVVGAARSLIGHPMADTTHAIGTLINPKVAAKDDPAKMYSEAKEGVDTALMALAPGRGVRPAPVPAAPQSGPLGVTLSKGQATGELPLIQREQAALRGATGDRAQARAQEFADQQRAEVEAAHEGTAANLDPFGQRVAETPQDAGAIVSDAIKNEAAQRKAGVKAAYDTAKEMPGEIHAGAFEGIAQRIKGDLSLRDDPVIIDDKTTPHANNALADIEKTIDRLRIPNKADPFGQPDPENIVGVNLKGVEQIRKRLSTFRRNAYGSDNAFDGPATSAIIDAFDKRVDAAIDGGLFNGDPRAIQAWKDARAAHADYSGTFTAGKGDPVGRVVEKILGKGKTEAAIPNDVADFLYGSSGVNPNTLNVGVAKRVKGILGDQSPEWSAVKQGLFSRLTEAAPGMTDLGHGKVAQRLNRFLSGDGREMAEALFTAPERQMLQSYADLHRKLEIPQGGANWSNTSTVLAPMLKKVSSSISAIIGGVIGHLLAPGLHGVGEAAGAMTASKVGSSLGQISDMRKIANQMPLVTEQLKKWQTAVTRANRANTPPSQAAVTVATANLSRALGPLGINLDTLLKLQGPAASRAKDEKPSP